jgi:hypothetical protein
MSDAITIKCPACKASLKLKNRDSVGKKVPCPKCKKPFVLKAPPAAAEDDMAFLDAIPRDETDYGAEEEEVAAAPLASSKSKAPAGKKAKKGKSSAGGNWVKPMLIGLAALVVVGLMIGGGVVAVSMMGREAANKIDLTYLPHDADVVVHIRVNDVLGSPFVQPLMANAQVKQQLDQLTHEYQLSAGDLKSVTMGFAGMSDVNLSKISVPGMGPPPAASPVAAAGIETVRGVVVFRMTKPLDSGLITKLPGLVAAEHQGKTYYRGSGVANPANSKGVYLAAPDVLLVANESEIHRIIEKGSKQARRAEFDFVETTPQILIAMVNKPNPSTTTSPPSTAPTGPPGMSGPVSGVGANPLPSLSNGKIKAAYLGFTFTQDIEIQAGLHCPGALPEVQGELEAYVSQQKTAFQAAKTKELAMLQLFGLGEMIPQLEATVNSFRVSGNNSVAHLNAQVPGAIKGSIEKGMSMASGMMGGGPGGLGGPNPFGGPPSQGPPGDTQNPIPESFGGDSRGNLPPDNPDNDPTPQ